MCTRRPFVAMLAAAVGAALGTSALAQPLNTNLVANPGFESVDPNITGPFGSVLILDWIDNDGDGDDAFAFAYSANYSGNPAPPDSGAYHYSGGFNTQPDQILMYQSVDLSSGPAGKLIQGGHAYFDLSAYFSGYFLQDDASFVRVFFLDEVGNDISPADLRVGGYDFLQGLPAPKGRRDWGQSRLGGPIPAGTRSVLVAIGAADADVNHDGYVDNINFQVTATNPAPAAFTISSPVAGEFFQGTSFHADWTDAFNAATYTVTVSPNQNLSSPVFTQTGVTASEFDFTGQVGNGVWYIGVSAVNSGGSTTASNGPVRFAVVTQGGGGGCRADFNHDGVSNSQDFFDFLVVFFQGC
jgi:hypothetical protein